MTEDLNEALTLMRRALHLLDRQDDPYMATPHLDLAISRLERGATGVNIKDEHDDGGGKLPN